MSKKLLSFMLFAMLIMAGAVRADSLSGLADVTVVDGAIVSLRYDGTEYIVANGDLLLGATGHGGYGLIEQYPDAVIDKLSEEHGEVDVRACSAPPELGERVSIIPNHICVVVNMQNSFYVKTEDGRLEKEPVDARGMLS